ncbi:thiamine pyrophosphate-dependent enzyme [bacterium]|nr:thiamine pyrophosphate-dependent enzyme [bacterium]
MTSDTIYGEILNNMGEGVISLKLNGTITTFNPAAEKIWALPASPNLGKPFAEVFLNIEKSDEFVQAVLDSIYKRKTIHHKRIGILTKLGKRTLTMTTSFLVSKDISSEKPGNDGIIIVFSDITEVEQLRQTVYSIKMLRAEQWVQAFREQGHVLAKVDPLNFNLPDDDKLLESKRFGIEESELDQLYTVFQGGEPVTQPLRKIIETFQEIYCGAIGIQFTHIDDLVIQQWLRKRIESSDPKRMLPHKTQIRILQKLIDAETFEVFVNDVFKGSKRFSLEGAETLIPLLDQAIETASKHKAEHVIIGMSHRGRLNVLVNIVNLAPNEIFRRFDQFDSGVGFVAEGDVRFHLGTETIRRTEEDHELKISICFNPSHLEFVSPVVLGRARALQDQVESKDNQRILPLVIHGDASFSGQGIVQETFNLSNLSGFSTGGAVHIVLNNQIGFTTQPKEGRSTRYATDVARMLQIPIFHVNGENPEAVDRVIRLAIEFWSAWRRDVVIDMYCYRRRGHMELDDPTFTQPELYRAISERQAIRKTYSENLVKLGQITREEIRAIETESLNRYQNELNEAKERAIHAKPQSSTDSKNPKNELPSTHVPLRQLSNLLEKLSNLPDGFTVHPKIRANFRRRQSMAQGKAKLDWAAGETLAYATLLSAGKSVRLTGQDSERGTFAHRHSVIHDLKTGTTYTPLSNLKQKQGAIHGDE